MTRVLPNTIRAWDVRPRSRNVVYDAMHPVISRIAHSRTAVRWLFRVSLPDDLRILLDPTPSLLAYVLRNINASGDQKALEVGVGQGALVGLSLGLATGIQLDGVDCDPACVKSSDRVARHNGASVNIHLSHFFDALLPDQQYDLVFFNPPYVPTHLGHELRLTERMQGNNIQAWNGGEDGAAVLSDFLRRVPAVSASRGRVWFGVQPMFVPDELVRRTLAATRSVLVKRLTLAFVPSVVYEVVPARNDGAAGGEPGRPAPAIRLGLRPRGSFRSLEPTAAGRPACARLRSHLGLHPAVLREWRAGPSDCAHHGRRRDFDF